LRSTLASVRQEHRRLRANDEALGFAVWAEIIPTNNLLVLAFLAFQLRALTNVMLQQSHCQ
jgi:hypothetical protein